MPDRLWNLIVRAGDVARTLGAIIGLVVLFLPKRRKPTQEDK